VRSEPVCVSHGSQGTCNLLSLVIGELVDEDYILYNRSHSVSAVIYGTSSMLSRPGQVRTSFTMKATVIISMWADAGPSCGNVDLNEQRPELHLFI
jgi:hypothetical protein